MGVVVFTTFADENLTGTTSSFIHIQGKNYRLVKPWKLEKRQEKPI